MSALLTVSKLTKRISDVKVLDKVSAEIREGEVTAFIGPNGAGKTSLFHAISGNMKPDTGQVVMDHTEITGMQPWRVAQLGLGRVFQDVRVFPNLTPVENVLAALHQQKDVGIRSIFQKGEAIRQKEARARELICDVGLEGELDCKAGDLSFGNQKLLAFARLMAGEFRVVLLDEPTAGISPVMANHLTCLIRQFAESGLAVAVIEHDMKFIGEISDRVYVLRSGAVFDSGPTTQVLEKPTVRELCLGL